MLAILGGAKLRALNVPLSPDARVVKCGYNAKTQEFLVDVDSASFENSFSEPRLPQEFHLEIQK